MKRAVLVLAVAALSALAFGCAYTNYSGYVGHKTTGEAKFWAAEIAFSGSGDPTLDGTYAYTAKYDNRGGSQGVVTIYSYRNPVFGSFSRDGQIDRDGDNVQGHSGILGGKFGPQFVSVDATGGGTCEFFANITQNKSATGAAIALCGTLEEEIDNDFDLQAAFGSLDSLLAQIWSGALTGEFTLELKEITFDDTPVAVDFPIGVSAGALWLGRFSVDLSQPGGPALVQAILDNTVDGQAYAVGLTFDGGLTVDLPAGLKVAFDHGALASVL